MNELNNYLNTVFKSNNYLLEKCLNDIKEYYDGKSYERKSIRLLADAINKNFGIKISVCFDILESYIIKKAAFKWLEER